MKIAFLTSHFPFQNQKSVGGIGTSIKNLGIGLLAQNISVRVLVYGQNEDEISTADGIIIQQIKNVKFKGLSWFLTRKKIEKIIDELYSNQEIDLVEVPDWTGISSFIKPKSCPLIIRLNGSDTYFCHLDKRPVKWINKFHERRALQNADELLSVSQFTADLTNIVFGLDKKFTIIPNSVDMNSFQADNENYQQQKTILYFGSLIRKKGLLELPLIFNKVVENNPSAKLIIIGQDVSDISTGNSSTWQMMKKMFSDKSLNNVEYLGSISHPEIKEKIHQATICVFPSFAEAFPVSWLEAMAMEKPIVASSIGWAKEMVDHGENGFLVAPTNHEVYAQRINDLLKDEALCLKLGKAARQKVNDFFDIKVITCQNIEFYQKVIRQKMLK